MENDSAEVNPESVDKLKTLVEGYERVKKEREAARDRVTSIKSSERKLAAEVASGEAQYRKLFELLTDCRLDVESGAVRVQQLQNEVNEKLVEHSLIHMRLHQLQNAFEKQLEKFYDLEHHKLQLQLAIDERLTDLRCELELLAAKRKDAATARNLLRSDIAERCGKIAAMRARFELENELLGRNEDGSTVTAVQLKIQTAQEREILMQRGGELNEKVIAAEKDIKALENTLLLLNHSNETYKRKLQQSTNDGKFALRRFQRPLIPRLFSEEISAMIESLRSDLSEKLNKLKNLKANLAMKTRMVADLHSKFSECERDLSEAIDTRLNRNDALMKVHKQILEQKTKLERAEREKRAARKSVFQKIVDRDYIRLFEVRRDAVK